MENTKIEIIVINGEYNDKDCQNDTDGTDCLICSDIYYFNIKIY